jgi:hypothetical protein
MNQEIEKIEEVRKVRVLCFPIGGAPEIREFTSTDDGDVYEDLREFIGNLVDRVSVGRGLDIWCDDEGLLTNPPAWNRLVGSSPMAGPLVLMRANDEGEAISLTDEDIRAFWALDHVVCVRDGGPALGALVFAAREDRPCAV